jgi:hypothetical protein
MNPPAAYRKHLLSDSGTPWFMFYTHGFDLSHRIWFVSVVMVLMVPDWFWGVFLHNDSLCDTVHIFLYVSFA